MEEGHPAHKSPVVVPVRLSFVRAPAQPGEPSKGVVKGHAIVVVVVASQQVTFLTEFLLSLQCHWYASSAGALTVHSIVAPPGELRVSAGVVLLAGNTVWSTPERLRGEVLTTRRYTNRCLPYLYLYLMQARYVQSFNDVAGRCTPTFQFQHGHYADRKQEVNVVYHYAAVIACRNKWEHFVRVTLYKNTGKCNARHSSVQVSDDSTQHNWRFVVC